MLEVKTHFIENWIHYGAALSLTLIIIRSIMLYKNVSDDPDDEMPNRQWGNPDDWDHLRKARLTETDKRRNSIKKTAVLLSVVVVASWSVWMYSFYM